MTNPDNVGGLLPCPFCGGEAELVGGEQDEFCHWHVQCTVCGAISGESLAPSTPDRDFASESWNRRELCRAAPAGGDVCKTCQGHGMIGWTTGQTPEQFDQHEAPCPDCSAPAGSGEVDLEEFREAVDLLRITSLGGKRDCERHGTFPHDFDRSLAKADRLLALIDSRAALLRKLQQGADANG